MLVNYNISKVAKKGDLLIFNENGEFEPISKDELLKDAYEQIRLLQDQIEQLQTQIRGVSKNTATILKGVLK